MVTPAVIRLRETPENLDRLDPLFAEPLLVERVGAGDEVGVRQKGLHA
jgi:hypothetical protein